MPVLHDKSKIERFYLPSTKTLAEGDQAFVDMEVGPLTAGDIIGVDPEASDTESAIRMLVSRIKGWNYTDSTGEAIPVSFETVKKLDMEDFAFLANSIPNDVKGLEDAEKKS